MTKIARKWSNYYLHVITRVNNANIHQFTIYIPPNFNKEQRFNILKNLTYELDCSINKSAGLNHVIVTGDFNIEGMKEMELIANTRGLT